MRKATTSILMLTVSALLCGMRAYAQTDFSTENSNDAKAVCNVEQEARIHICTPPKALPLFKADTLRIIILGDMMMHASQITTARDINGNFDFSSYFKHLETRISNADIAIGNMEFALGGMPYSGYPAFSAPDDYAEYLAGIGIDIFLCANNHVLDKGMNGLKRTLAVYDELHKKYGIRYIGLSTDGTDTPEGFHLHNPLFHIRKGIRLAFINYTYGTNAGGDSKTLQVNRLSNKLSLMDAIGKSSGADVSIVLPHWGEEYRLRHSGEQRSLAESMVKAGADVIVGSHPHVVQDFETIANVPVIYSLGNAVSNMSAPNTQVELMTEIVIIRNENGDICIEEPEFIWLWCSRPGGYTHDYNVIPIEDFIGTRDEWVGKWEYDKMISSWHRVASETGIGM